MILSLSLPVKAICFTMNKSMKKNVIKNKPAVRQKSAAPRALQRREGQRKPLSAPSVAPPRYSTLANGDVRINRREYLRAIEAPAGVFSISSNHINPGLELFTWLSEVSDNYEEYVFERLSFEYKPVISSATYSGSMGSVVVAVMYNAGAGDLETYPQMVEYSGSVEKRVCDPLIMRVNVSKNTHAGEDHYIRTGSVPSGEDVKTYDIGKLLVAIDHASSSFSVGTLLGHLYADYSVILRKPKLKSDPIPEPVYPPFGMWCTNVCTPGWLESGLKTLTLTTMEATFITDPTNPRKLVVTIPDIGRYYIVFYSTPDVSSTMTVTIGAGATFLGMSGTSGTAPHDQVYDASAPFENAWFGTVNCSMNNTEMTFVPADASSDITGFNISIVGLAPGSIAWNMYPVP